MKPSLVRSSLLVAASSPAVLARRGLLRWLPGLAAACLALGAAHAQTAASYPSKPITIVVGYPPGGSTDLMGRMVASELSSRLGVSVVVENVGGAGGAIGAQKVANAAPDGYTLLVGANNEIALNKLVTSSVKYDLKDFTPIGLIASQPLVLVASIKSGVHDVDGLLRLLRANPGKYSYGSSGVGTALHVAGEMVKQKTGVFMTHIPYRGVAPLTSDLVGGNIDFGVFVLSSGLPHIQSGKVVPLGTTLAKRSPATPQVPALAEHPSLKGMDLGAWFALMGPAKLPDAVQAKLKAALDDALRSPELRKKMEANASTVAAPGVDAGRFIAGEVTKYKAIVDFAHIKE